MDTTEVNVLANRDDAYSIHVGADIIDRIGEWCKKHGLGERALIITDTHVAPLYLGRVVASLERASFSPHTVVVPAGENEKNWQRAGQLLDECVQAQLERTSFIVALGGGVIGDLAGFVASVYMRGIRFVQVPTTLLAQVDASVGGKVAVNHPQGKNLLGAFHQPSLVISDTSLLNTLSDRELRAGMAEVVKHGLIRDRALYEYIRAHPKRFLTRDPEALQRAVVDSCRIKSAIVERDEKEQGERAVLNFGHTVGHAIEAAAGYGTYTHGEAIAVGMVAEAMLSAGWGDVTEQDVHTLCTVLRSLQLPTQLPANLAEKAVHYVMRDKKVQEGTLRVALLRNIGRADINDTISLEQISRVLTALQLPANEEG